MKRIFSIAGSLLPEGIPIPLIAGIVLFLLSWTASCNKNNNIPEIPGDNFMKSSNLNINATNLGAIPDDGVDDTHAIQKAIDSVAGSGGGTVWLNDGDYNVNADTSIHLKSNVTLSMTGHARLIADTSSHERYYVIRADNIHDARILGGRIIGDRDYHNGTTGEHGYGIAVQGCDHVRVVNTIINKCWGDGLIVGRGAGHPSTNTTIKGVISRDNRRQAISIFDVDGLVIDSCKLYNTGGTKPEDGIDIEPDVATTPRTARNIAITHCDIYSNGGNGVEINVRGSNTVSNVTIQYNTIHGNKYSGYVQNADSVNFTNNWLYGNTYDGNHVHNNGCTNSVFTPNTYAAP